MQRELLFEIIYQSISYIYIIILGIFFPLKIFLQIHNYLYQLNVIKYYIAETGRDFMGTGSSFKTKIASLRRSLSCFCREDINFKDFSLILISKVMRPVP